jgi:large subunit ribosomal protein L4
MPTVPVLGGKDQATLELSSVFGGPVRVPLVHQAVVRELAARRTGTHDTKGRSEVSGGGRKPWKQKGTGRARQGSIRATQWKGGGKPFGPTPRSYDKRMPSEMRRAELRESLSARIAAGGLAVVEKLGLNEPRTKALTTRLRALGSSRRRRCSWCQAEPHAGPGCSQRAVAQVETLTTSVSSHAQRSCVFEQAALPSEGAQVMKDPGRCWCARSRPRRAWQKEDLNVVTFEVATGANKRRFARRWKIFGVKVASVRTASREGKWKRMGRFEGRRRGWKKAVVTLAPGHKIELVEGA